MSDLVVRSINNLTPNNAVSITNPVTTTSTSTSSTSAATSTSVATAASSSSSAVTSGATSVAIATKAGVAATTSAGILGSKLVLLTIGATFAALASAGVIAGLVVGLKHSDDSSTVSLASGITRTIYLAAEEVEWNYAPYNINNCTGLPFGEAESIFMIGENQEEGNGHIGSIYHKRIWKEYTDATYTIEKAVESVWAHKGFNGPPIRVAVGDTLKVYVKNKSRYPVSFHPIDFHLVSIQIANNSHPEKLSTDTLTIQDATIEDMGSNINSASSQILLDPFSAGYRSFECKGSNCDTTEDSSSYIIETLPDEVMVYTYYVPATAGPTAESGTDTVARLYQSLSYNTHELSLSGIIIVSDKNKNGIPSGTHVHELQAIFSVSNENVSPYLNLNIVDYILRPRYMYSGMHHTIDIRATVVGSPVFFYDTLAPEDILMSLYQAAAEYHEVDASVIENKLSDVTYFQTLITSTKGIIHSIDNIPLHIVINTTNSIVDTTEFVNHFGQYMVEEALTPLLASLYLEDADFNPDEFDESNMMHSLNGIMYCNHEPMQFPEGSIARWYGGVIGTEVDMHTLHFHGNVLLYNGHRTDAIQLLPRALATADMHADNPGKWLFHCHVTDHLLAGMLTTYTVIPYLAPLPDANHVYTPFNDKGEIIPPTLIASQLTGVTRYYYIAAEPEVWNFTSETGYADCQSTAGSTLPPEETLYTLPASTKVRYVEYTDATFTTRKERNTDWEHLQMIGPIVRGEVGDTLKVMFLNRSPRPFSVHPHGILYRKNSEGAPYHDGSTHILDTGDNMVEYNTNWTYTWFVPESAGPGPVDGDSIVWLYHGHVHEAEDENIGLVGAIIITARGKTTSSTELRPKNVDREFVLLFKVFEPVDIPELDNFTMNNNNNNNNNPMNPHHHRQLEDLHENHPHMFTINGKVFCGVPGLSMYTGERVRWYLVSLGNEIDVHHSSFAGNSLIWKEHRVNGVPLLAGTMHQADMIPELPGNYLIFDGSQELQGLGTQAMYTVLSPPNTAPTITYPSPSYTYYVGAKEIEWDYIGPSNTDSCVPEFAKAHSPAFNPEPMEDQYDIDNTDLNRFPEDGRVFVRHDGNFLGRKYKKAVYRAYSDETFHHEINRTHSLPPLSSEGSLRGSIYNLSNPALNSDEHLGLLGPIIRGAVGQTIRIVFKNLLPSTSPLTDVNLVPFNALPIVGFRVWNKTTTNWVPMNADEAKSYPVPQDETVEYTIYVSPSAGPAARDPSSIVWAYGSTVDATNHLYAGLYGPFIISKDNSYIVNPDVDREYVISMMISDESLSPYIDLNIDTYAINASAVDKEDPDFQESNKKHAFNGRLFCNLPGLTAKVGEKIRWHLLASGGPLDFHTPTFHGGGTSILYDGGYRPTLDIFPGMTLSADSVAESSGLYMLECGVNDHWLAGMRALLYIQDSQGQPLAAMNSQSQSNTASNNHH